MRDNGWGLCVGRSRGGGPRAGGARAEALAGWGQSPAASRSARTLGKLQYGRFGAGTGSGAPGGCQPHPARSDVHSRPALGVVGRKSCQPSVRLAPAGREGCPDSQRTVPRSPGGAGARPSQLPFPGLAPS